MSEAQLFNLLHELRLAGFRAELEHQLQHPSYADLPFRDRLLQLLQAETTRRYRNKIDRLLKAALFKYQAEPEDIDYQHSRNLDKSEVLGLLSCDWIARQQNLVLTGASGTGKTWLACAFGVAAVRREYSAAYFRAGRLAEVVKFARLDGTIGKFRKRLSHLDVLIVDDFVYRGTVMRQRVALVMPPF
ncbi:hypothetical protein LPB142_17470 (plasmid) [Rhodobacter xanthinilyticus]|uniref:IstB-like ATP-binding domain-containing protein n=1 Tax=Rhodobacter xanthinilyticus TaxID=1850250 RepID=A0A1D9MH52_9RHOB|nr:ATP-binding protein [Rhodobacter xanthinilyticus]AOZ71166.1 hypothetical protein LPB142_16905 [Rhodobacter xanthinilyticus]AOZ71250.1 hypothetical protein LPB142_17470 [Rhodobacter xanthinilyticus]